MIGLLLALLAQPVIVPGKAASPVRIVTPSADAQQPGSGSRAPFINVRAAPYFAVGDGVADDTAAIQAAITATPDAGMVYIPAGTYKVTGELLLTKRIWIKGSGWGSVLQVAASVGSSTDVLHIKPSGTLAQGFRLEDFYITPASGTPARYGINIDGTTTEVSYLVMDHVRIDTLGNYAMATSAESGTNGAPYLVDLRDCYFSGGVNMTNWGDSVTAIGNLFTGPRDLLVNLFPVNHAGSDGGAHGFYFVGNNVTLTGGIVIVNAWQGTVSYNNIEAVATSTEANNALIDVQGNVSPGPVQGLKIEGNYLGAAAAFVADTVRVDRGVATMIRDNYAGRGSGVTYRLTANADRTMITGNRQAPAGELITTWLADLGTNTQVDYIHPNTGIRTITGPAFTTNAGVTSYYFTGLTGKVGANATLGFSSGNDPTSTGLDTGFSRLTANQVACGNGGFGDATCLLGLGQLVASAAITSGRVVLTYSATIATDASLGNSFSITATNGTAFTISNPTNLRTGQVVRYIIRNASGGALGAITWSGTFKINATAIAPANATSRSVEFVYDGTNLVELWRGALDVPN